MSLLLGKLKLWGWAIGAGLLMALYAALKFSRGQLEDARYEVRKYKYQVKQRTAVDDNLSEVNQEFSRRASIREKEKQDAPSEVPSRLRDNNRF